MSVFRPYYVLLNLTNLHVPKADGSAPLLGYYTHAFLLAPSREEAKTREEAMGFDHYAKNDWAELDTIQSPNVIATRVDDVSWLRFARNRLTQRQPVQRGGTWYSRLVRSFSQRAKEALALLASHPCIIDSRKAG